MKLLRRMFCFRTNTIAMSLLCVVLSGCGGSGVDTVAVHGKITLDGKPLSAGLITFQPVKIEASLPNRPAFGSIQSDGQYSLSTFRPDDGAVPGDYVVILHAAEGITPVDEFSKAAAATAGPTIPAIYTNVEQSPLKATIPAAGSGAQQIDFDLKSK